MTANVGVIQPGSDPEREIREAMGFDIQRSWASAAQVFLGEAGEAILVFKEQVAYDVDPPPGKTAPDENSKFVRRNVASIVLPQVVALELGKILIRMIEPSNGAS